MPPTLGLIGKLYLFPHSDRRRFIGLAVIGVLTSLISAYYYLRVCDDVDAGRRTAVESEPWLDLTTAATAIATVVLSFLPAALFALARAVLKLF